MKRIIIAACCLMFFCSQAVVFAQDKNSKQEMTEALRKVTLKNFEAYEEEDLARIMETVHPQSPGYNATRDFSAKIFPDYDIKYELLDLHFIAMDGDFALARTKQKTIKVSGPQFRDNILDAIVVFKQNGKKWKFWSQATLSIQYLN